MHSHLVTVEIGVKRCTYQRMKFNRLTFYQNRLKRLDTKTVKSRSTVQHNRMLTNDFFQNIPYGRLQFFYHFLGIFNIVCRSICHQLFHNKRFKQLDSHLLRQTTLVNLQFRSHYDYGTSRIVDTFTKQVLTETSLFTFQHIRQGFQGTVTRSGYRTAAASIIDERIHSFLQHTFLIADNNIGSSQLQKSFQTVVTVDNTAVQIIQVRSCKTSTIQLYHRTKIRRNHWDYRHNHPVGMIAGLAERLYHFQSLDDTGTFLSGRILQFFFQCLGFLFQINSLQKFLNRLCSHTHAERIAKIFSRLLVFLLRKHLLHLNFRSLRLQHNIRSKI